MSRPHRRHEEEAYSQGYARVAGIDEAGRGPLAGPVVAAACILPASFDVSCLNDSKLLSAPQREAAFELLTTHPHVEYCVALVDAPVIDEINILQATIRAMLESVQGLVDGPDFLLVDGLKLPHPAIPSKKIIKGDQQSVSIAAASILAKVTRDRIMVDADRTWPAYGFAKHKGYGTAVHRAAIEEHGPCPIHRFTFAPIKTMDGIFNAETRTSYCP
jgi:ribonuclease HII